MTQIPDNVTTFNAVAGVILLKLFESHPRPIDLAAEDVMPDVSITDQELFGDTMTWLQTEGFLRYGMTSGFQLVLAFHRTQLTEKGLATLTRPLPALGAKEGPKKSVGTLLADAGKAFAVKGAGAIGSEAAKLEFAHAVARLFGG